MDKKRQKLSAQVDNLRRQISDLEDEAARIAREEIGIERDDLVIDEMGVVYRVDQVSAYSLGWTYDRKASKTTLAIATKDINLRGVALHENGVPRWKDARHIRGKVKKYEPESN